MVIVDTIWEPKVKDNLKKINEIKNKIKLKGVEINPTYPDSTTTPNPNLGPWENKYYETLKEIKCLEEVWVKSPLFKSFEEVNSHIKESEKKEMKKVADSWLQSIVDRTKNEAGKTDEYDSSVDRWKGTNYHQRGHYFIFYEDGSKEHWLALYPGDREVGENFFDRLLVDGHNHQAFILEFDKPVKKFIDVYTCVGCGAIGQGFTDLHPNYDFDIQLNPHSNNSDSWDFVHKGKPFDYWAEELYVNDLLVNPNFAFPRETNDYRIMSKNRRHCLGNLNHPSDYHVWQGKIIQDLNNRTFDKAYGYIPQGGTIQWRLTRDIKKEDEWIKKRIPYHMGKLWGEKEFTSYAEKNDYQQASMHMIIDELLERPYEIEYFENKQNINEQLEKGLKKRFWELIIAKRETYIFLEKWVKLIVAGGNNRSEKIASCKSEFNRHLLKNEAQTIKKIRGRQVEKFIREGKVKEVSSELELKVTTYNQIKVEVDLLYQEFFNRLGLNKKVSEIQQSEHVAQILIEP